MCYDSRTENELGNDGKPRNQKKVSWTHGKPNGTSRIILQDLEFQMNLVSFYDCNACYTHHSYIFSQLYPVVCESTDESIRKFERWCTRGTELAQRAYTVDWVFTIVLPSCVERRKIKASHLGVRRILEGRRSLQTRMVETGKCCILHNRGRINDC